MTEVLIVPTGTANIASVMAAFRRLGAAPRLGEDPREVVARWAGWSSTGWTRR
jgi:imidazoleglycerol phosphate synthase glutamine amidotransferase subunit HisH